MLSNCFSLSNCSSISCLVYFIICQEVSVKMKICCHAVISGRILSSRLHYLNFVTQRCDWIPQTWLSYEWIFRVCHPPKPCPLPYANLVLLPLIWVKEKQVGISYILKKSCNQSLKIESAHLGHCKFNLTNQVENTSLAPFHSSTSHRSKSFNCICSLFLGLV